MFTYMSRLRASPSTPFRTSTERVTRTLRVPWPKQHRRLRTRDRSRHLVEVEYHTGVTTNAVLEQVREAEIVQAMGRDSCVAYQHPCTLPKT
jgi:hypothetical protein